MRGFGFSYLNISNLFLLILNEQLSDIVTMWIVYLWKVEHMDTFRQNMFYKEA